MATPKSAAAVILIREEPELEVFWVRRAPQMIFQGGYFAFPGGQLDPNEDAKVCAARELEEETGVRIIPNTLMDVGRWVTPAFVPRRFDTCFFLGQCPNDQTARVITGEHDLGEWIKPAHAISKWMEGDILMAPPILHALKCLSEGVHDIQRRMRASPWAHGEPTPEVELRAGILLVPLRTPTLPPATHTNCYVIGGEEVIVIDPASPYEDQQDVLDRILARKRIREIWLTHLHGDHVSGAMHLKNKPTVKTAAHPITKRDLEGVVVVDRLF
jgi:8-oxo-dGTP pyrophosphatase MutT (NUDIX family)